MDELREIVARAIVDEISSHNFVLDNSNLAHVMMDGGFDFQRTADAALSALRAEGALVEGVTFTIDEITLIAEALQRWQNIWLARNPDLTHMSAQKYFDAKSTAQQKAEPALKILGDKISSFYLELATHTQEGE